MTIWTTQLTFWGTILTVISFFLISQTRHGFFPESDTEQGRAVIVAPQYELLGAVDWVNPNLVDFLKKKWEKLI